MPDGQTYADVTKLFYKDEKLELTEYFPITGESKDVLKKTPYSRYGNFEIFDSFLPELEGEWENESGYMDLLFTKNVMCLNGKTTKIHILKPGEDSYLSGKLIIADEDPTVTEWQGLTRFEYCNGVLSTRLLVCDAPPTTLVFTKKKA